MKIKEPYSTGLYVLLGIVLAFGINSGMALGLSTDLPIVAVESNSMKPTFMKGDILILQGADSFELDDIIVFSPAEGKTPVVHRIVAINTDGSYQTKGDANTNQLHFEKHITQDQIHGKVIFIAPYLGWIKIGITELILPNIILLAGLVIFLYILFIGISKVWR